MVTLVSPEAAVRPVRAISPNKVGEAVNQCRLQGRLPKQTRAKRMANIYAADQTLEWPVNTQRESEGKTTINKTSSWSFWKRRSVIKTSLCATLVSVLNFPDECLETTAWDCHLFSLWFHKKGLNWANTDEGESLSGLVQGWVHPFSSSFCVYLSSGSFDAYK